MTNLEINQRIDQICQRVTSASLLNALHACRPGHPWNTSGTNHFANATFMLAAGNNGANWGDLDFCAKMAKKFDAEAAR